MLFERRCPGCGVRARALCPPCQQAMVPAPPLSPPPGLDSLHAWCCYEGTGRALVLAFKHRGRSDLARWLAAQLVTPAEPSGRTATTSPRPGAGGGPIVTWVPASRAGRRARGYDQGRLLARAVGRRAGWPVAELLRRPADARTQQGRTRDERMAGVGFIARRRPAGPVLVLDDVTTTGASLSQAAAALRRAGASEVHGLAVAVADRDLGPWAPAAALPTVRAASQ